ncbi:MAG: 1-acyl-sn-glycerol-3-phosphate acyltransferase [Syntrophobacteraceae bacterium]|nr:1-acyl-sn-glycerol-3-phosphate acyltransferase [Syntrophobacteraceae bacterium]
MAVIRSVFFYLVLIVSTFYMGIAAIITHRLTGRNEKPHLIGRLWARINLWAAGVKVKVRGLGNIDRNRPYVFAANHQSLFDIFVILGALPVQFRWLAKEELFRIFILGPAMTATGYIPIDRTDRRKAFESLNRAAEMVKGGVSVVIFPEGTRSPDGVMREFKKGGFILAIRSQQPIVPISISGSHHVLSKKGGWIIRPGVIEMTLGVPIPTRGIAPKDRDILAERVREAIGKHLRPEEAGHGPRGTGV